VSGSVLTDLSDVTITSATTGDLLRFDGAEWVNYPDSNYAAASHTHLESEITDGALLARLADTETITGAWTFDNNVVIDNGNYLRIYDATTTDYGQFSHNGTDFYLTLTNTDWWRVTGITNGILLQDGPEVRIYDNTNADYAAFEHDGTDFNTTFTNTADWNVSGNSRYNWVDTSHRHLVMGVTGGANPADCATIDLMEYTSGQVDWGVAAGYGARIKYDGSANRFLLYTGNQTTQYEHIRMPRDNSDVHLCGDTIGKFQTVSGQYGSVEVSGAEGSSGTWHGYSIGGRLVFMDNAGSAALNRGGIYDDANNWWVLQYNGQNSDEAALYDAGTSVARTLPASSGGFEVNNTSTGAGFERVLTTSDLGGGGLDTKVKTATTSRSSTTTFSADPHLASWSLTAGQKYGMIGHLVYIAANITPDIKFDWVWTNAPADAGDWGLLQTDDAKTLQEADSESPMTTAMTALDIASREQTAWIHGHFEANASTGGTVSLHWAQNTSSATSTQLLLGSWIALIDLGA
jgi:hypothetical protein